MTTPTPDPVSDNSASTPSEGESSASESPRNEAAPAAPSESTEATGDVAESIPAEPPQSANVDDELPEREPLTPELVEDEAIRGDFVMRWAVVLLALLIGFTKIADTAVLVHIKTGQYIANHGFLPPKHDVFSYTANERPWVNLAWLFDLGVAALYALGSSGWALTVFKAVVAGLVFGLLVHISRLGVSTWWGSILAALGVIATYDEFGARPELMTMLGLIVTLWILFQWEERGSARIWALPAVFLLWSNVDPRVFLGLVVVVLYAAGNGLGALLGRQRGDAKTLGVVAVLCVLAAMVNPFGWEALAAPWSMYRLEYPAARSVGELEYVPMTDSRFWDGLDHRTFAGLLLLASAGVSLFLNRWRVPVSHVLVVAGLAAVAVAGSRELAPVALVCAGLATLNFQEWYRDKFRQTYSVDPQELLFSRGGRVVTVLAFFGIAYLAISGRLGAGDVGLGLHGSVTSQIQGLRSDLKGSFDNKPFNFNLSQGDLLVWVDQQVFVDSRLPLYAGVGDANLLAVHNRARHALRKAREGQPLGGKPEVWKETFNRYGVTHVLPRLGGPNPDYITHFDLQESEDWQLTRLGAAASSYYRRDLDNPELAEYLKQNAADFPKLAFREESKPLDQRPDWPRPLSFYERYLTPPDTTEPVAIQQASHYNLQLQRALEERTKRAAALRQNANQTAEQPGDAAVTVPIDSAVALAHLAIRKANEGLAQDPQSAVGYRILGTAYELLSYLESDIAAASGGRPLANRRYFQALNAYSQSLVVEPNNEAMRLKLIEFYNGSNKFDLALREIQEFRKLTRGRAQSDQQIQAVQQTEAFENQLNQQVAKIRQTIEQQLAKGVTRYRVAVQTYQQGFVLNALRVLREDPLLIANQLPAQQLQALLLMEAGRVEEAFDSYSQLEGVAEQFGVTNWRPPAALAALANGRYERAVELWNKEAAQARERAIAGVLQTLPLVGPPPTWPLRHTDVTADGLYSAPYQAAEATLNVALCHLETGDLEEATDALHRVLADAPDTAYRPLVRFYLAQLTGEEIDPLPPSQWIPVTPDLFGSETDQPADSAADQPAEPANAAADNPGAPADATADKPEESADPAAEKPAEPADTAAPADAASASDATEATP